MSFPNTNSIKINDQNVQKIIQEYNEKSDLIIRKMFQVLVQTHKKIDQAAYQEWVKKVKTK
ncbi:hypothetical protein HYW55_06345 [Candidatus Gottesmanbacteria bacterium]|nr:hypothetical protein [Candidatus Gottesmanbacteria bacterium]